ncbi:MAG: hypothetical protein V2I82_11945 [Halieaceae bacterium]|jgi:hypothetical protein|nr:hypothetical protein [Halieaceae bacterium]
MTSIEHFTDWHAEIRQCSERTVVALTESLLRHRDDSEAFQADASEHLPIPEGALQHSHWSFVTRRVDRARPAMLLGGDLQPRVGDLVLARVEQLGHHGNLQLVDGRRRRLFPGDLVIVAYANRYACEQFEAEVPQSLSACHLVAGGGIAARALSWHDRIVKGPTAIRPLGLLADEAGVRINVGDFALDVVAAPSEAPPVFAVVGTAMDAGKTETAAYLVRGLRAAGRRAGYIKVTGTGAGGDGWLLRDAGAESVLDFTDAGLPSTFRTPIARLESVMETLIHNTAHAGMDAIVMEIADGVFQQETRQLLRSKTFAHHVSGIVLAARDAMGASAGLCALREQQRPVLALSGLLTASPLQRREAEEATGIVTLNRENLASAPVALRLLASADCEPQREVAL